METNKDGICNTTRNFWKIFAQGFGKFTKVTSNIIFTLLIMPAYGYFFEKIMDELCVLERISNLFQNMF